jgi:hypothetical protein
MGLFFAIPFFPRKLLGIGKRYLASFSQFVTHEVLRKASGNCRLSLRVGFVRRHTMPTGPLRVRSSHHTFPLVELVRHEPGEISLT